MSGAEYTQFRWLFRWAGVTAAIFAVHILGLGSVFADTLITTNNERFVGKVIEENPNSIVFQSQLAGRLTVPRSAVKELQLTPSTVSSAQKPAPSVVTTNPPASGTNNLVFPFKPSDPFDWIQLKSGEWLKGKIKSLQDEKLEFDSEEMDLHTFTWKDVRILRTAGTKSVRFEHNEKEKEIIRGSLLITTNTVVVMGEGSTNSYRRSDLLAITQTGARELDKWSGDLSLGLSFRSGNTREVDFTGQASIARRTPTTRLGLNYLGNFGEVQGTQTENNHRISTSFDVFLSRRLFLRVPDIEYYKDPLQDIEHRLTLGGSVGYDIIHTARTEWDVTIGPAWQRNWFVSVDSGDRIVDGTAFVFSSRFDMELTKKIDLLLEYRGQVTGPDQGDNVHHAEARLEFEIHKRLNLDISFIWDRIASPQEESSGDKPQKDDLRLTLGLGVKF